MRLLTMAKALFSAPKGIDTGLRIAEKASDGIISGIDKMFYTDEEKSEANQKTLETVQGFWKTFATENSEQSKARREIAFLLVKTFVAVLFIGIFMIALGEEQKLNLMLQLLGAVYFGQIIGAIIATYFVPHQFSKIMGKKNDK